MQLLVERARGCVEVHISHLPLDRKLTVSFGDLCYGYPSGEITVDVTHHCGDVSAETAQVRKDHPCVFDASIAKTTIAASLQRAIRGFKAGHYGRLYSMCEELVKLVSSS